jgi:hypothetical protein
MKSNRCECGRKKDKTQAVCVKCISNMAVVTEDVIKDTPMAEIIKKECAIEDKLDEITVQDVKRIVPKFLRPKSKKVSK